MRPLVYRIEGASALSARRQWDARISRFLRAMSFDADMKTGVLKSVSIYCEARSWTMFFSPRALLSLESLDAESLAAKLEEWLHTAFDEGMLSLACPPLECYSCHFQAFGSEEVPGGGVLARPDRFGERKENSP